MMHRADFLNRLHRAMDIARGQDTSDFDLNAGRFGGQGAVLTDAAVLVGLVERGGQTRVVLTKRTSALKHHPGQVAFPGGKRDAADADLHATAMREANEEIGLSAEHVDILGDLGRHETVTGFTVTPVLGMISPEFVATPEAGEVAEVFEVPFDFLMDPAKTRIEGRMWHGTRRRYYVMPYGPFYIWGATARMIVALRAAWEAAE